MSKEKDIEKDPTLIEYENLIEELMKENETLKNKIIDLEEQNTLYKDIADSIEEVSASKDRKKPTKLFKKVKKKEEFKPSIGKAQASRPHDEQAKAFKAHVKKTKTSKVSKVSGKKVKKITEPQIFESPPQLSTSEIVEGTSRRQCPVCGNTQKGTIKEEADKTRLINDYPRMYAKKLKCGSCGTYWRISYSE